MSPAHHALLPQDTAPNRGTYFQHVGCNSAPVWTQGGEGMSRGSGPLAVQESMGTQQELRKSVVGGGGAQGVCGMTTTAKNLMLSTSPSVAQ